MVVDHEQRAPQLLAPSDVDTPSAPASLESAASTCGARSTRTLSRSLRAPAQARRFVEEHICARHATPATASVALVASEVVTRAVLLGEGPVSIRLECDVTSLTLSVSCWMRAASATGDLRLGDDVSRLVIHSICHASGTEQTEQGLTMWCTIPAGTPRHGRVTGHDPGRQP